MNLRGRGKRGHGGICLYICNDILEGVTVVEKLSEGFLWVKLEQKFFSIHDDLYICFCYIPPKDSIYFKNVDFDLFDLLERKIRHYSDFGRVAVIGDLNARTASLYDEPVSCEGIERYIESLSGLNISEAELAGRRFMYYVDSILLVRNLYYHYSGLDNGESLRGQTLFFKHEHGNVILFGTKNI